MGHAAAHCNGYLSSIMLMEYTDISMTTQDYDVDPRVDGLQP